MSIVCIIYRWTKTIVIRHAYSNRCCVSSYYISMSNFFGNCRTFIILLKWFSMLIAFFLRTSCTVDGYFYFVIPQFVLYFTMIVFRDICAIKLGWNLPFNFWNVFFASSLIVKIFTKFSIGNTVGLCRMSSLTRPTGLEKTINYLSKMNMFN